MSEYTIVAFYGPKSDAFCRFIGSVEDRIKESPIGKFFDPYDFDQIHATIVGLEMIAFGGINYNLNTWEDLKEKRQIKLEGCIGEFIRYSKDLSVRFGGFNASFDARLSWNQSLHLRSFGINTKTHKVVLNGWPVVSTGNKYQLTDAIWMLRSVLFKSHNMRHKYHALEDNDMFMVLGDLKDIGGENPSRVWFDDQVARLNFEIQQMLAESQPHYEVLSLDEIKLVAYEHDSLATRTSRSWPVRILDENQAEVKQWLGIT